MSNILGIIIILMYIFAMFHMLGYIYIYYTNVEIHYTKSLIIGVLLYYSIFYVIYIPIQFTNKSLTLLSVLWGLVSLGVIIGYVYLCQKKKNQRHNAFQFIGFSENKYYYIIILTIIILFVFRSMKTTINYSLLDSSFYNSGINNMVYSGTLNYYDGYTGTIIDTSAFKTIRLYEVHIATISTLFNVHPLIVINRVMGILEIVGNMFIVLLIFKEILINYKKIIVALVIYLFININMCGSIYTASSFLFYRLAETKSITANITLPLVVLICIYIYKKPDNRINWYMLFVVSLLGVAINDSALFLLPACIIVNLILLPLMYKKIVYIKNIVLILLPCIFYIFLYVGVA